LPEQRRASLYVSYPNGITPESEESTVRWAWKLGEFRGIGVYVHATFLLLIGFVALSHWSASQDVAKTLEGIGFILALFVCVVLHEFGHALTAARYGIKTRDITLLPIGGVARLERMPEEPLHELWVALAGPAVNVVIALILLIGLMASATLAPLEQLTVTAGPFFERLLVVNVFLVVFNMLPAFPMDGGRVLRALLATRMEYTQATQIAASIGQAMALAFGFLGFFTNPMLLFIALFVWIGATQEAGLVQIRHGLGGVPVVRAMQTDFRVLDSEDPLSRAVEVILAGSQQDFPVLSGDRLVGVLTRTDLLTGLSRDGRDSVVSAAMHHEFETVDASEMLETAFRQLQTCDCHMIPVLRQGQLIGLITMDNIGEFIAIQSAVESKTPPAELPIHG